MRFFLISFFLIYGFLHLYVLIRVRKGLRLPYRQTLSLSLFMAVMTFSPLIVYYAEKWGYDPFARILSLAGFAWMGFLFLFISLLIVTDIIVFASMPILSPRRENPGTSPYRGRSTILIPFCLAVLICIYGFFEARDIRTEHIRISTAKLPEKIRRLRIVQISDVHLGLIVREDRLKRIIKKVKKASPDILVSTGDLVDGQISRLDGLSSLLREVNPPYGKYAVTGNHEYYAGITQSIDFTTRAGFRLLKGDIADSGGIIYIAGVDDQAGDIFNLRNDIPERNLLARLDKKRFILLLKHRPLIDRYAKGLFDLQLSGHTHKGQIFPFGLLTRMYYQHDAGYIKVTDASHLYVSRGSGTWGPPFRFLSPPEVTIIDVVRD